MRELCFKAWDKRHRKWVYGNNLSHLFAIYDAYKEHMELVEYIGRKDKSGKKIYSGDIVEQLGKGVYEVRWEKRCAGFMLGKDNDWRWVKEGYEKDYEVLGNIYEHPELLNDKIKATIIDECGTS